MNLYHIQIRFISNIPIGNRFLPPLFFEVVYRRQQTAWSTFCTAFPRESRVFVVFMAMQLGGLRMCITVYLCYCGLVA